MRPPGFEPGLRAWKARIITRLDYGRNRREPIVNGYDLRVMLERTQLDRSVEGYGPIISVTFYFAILLNEIKFN